jgi:hypothetical protein
MTGWLPRILGLFHPACAAAGAAGLRAPEPVDFNKLRLPRPPNSALAAPPGMHLSPDIITRARELPPYRLYELLKRVALSQPGTVLHADWPERLQAHFVARSGLCSFPALVITQITPDSMPALYSRSVYGRIDFGANRRRLIAWLAHLDAALIHA